MNHRLEDDGSAVQQLIGSTVKDEFDQSNTIDYMKKLNDQAKNVGSILSNELVDEAKVFPRKQSAFTAMMNKNNSNENTYQKVSSDKYLHPVLPGIKVTKKLNVKLDDYYTNQHIPKVNFDNKLGDIELVNKNVPKDEDTNTEDKDYTFPRSITKSKTNQLYSLDGDDRREKRFHTVTKFLKESEREPIPQIKFDMAEATNYRKRSLRKQTVEMRKRFSVHKRTSLLDPSSFSKMLRKSEENTEYGKLIRWLKTIDIVISIILTINIVLAIVDNDIYIDKSNAFVRNYLSSKGETEMTFESLLHMEQRPLDADENTLRILNMIISAVSTCLMFIHYKIKVKILQSDKMLSEFDGLFSSGLYKQMFVDMCVCLIFFPPYINKVITGVMLNLSYLYSLNSLITLLIMSKFYIILRFFYFCSRWTTNTATAICRNHNVQSGIHFAIKCEMKKRPGFVLTLLFIIVLSLLSFEVRQFEYGVISDTDSHMGSKGINDLTNLANCFWLTIVTMTTVGFGDYYPRSHLGRFIGVISCVIGMLLLSLIVVSLSSISEFTTEEKKAFVKLKKLFAEENLENKAANVISNLLMLRKLGKQTQKESYKPNLNKRFIVLTQLKKEISIFKNDYKIAHSYSLPVDEMLRRLEDKLKDDIVKLSKTVSKIKGVDLDLKMLSDEQGVIQSDLKEIVKMQEDISNYLIQLNNETYLANLKKNEEIVILYEDDEINNIKTKTLTKLKVSTKHLFVGREEEGKISKRSANKKLHKRKSRIRDEDEQKKKTDVIGSPSIEKQF